MSQHLVYTCQQDGCRCRVPRLIPSSTVPGAVLPRCIICDHFLVLHPASDIDLQQGSAGPSREQGSVQTGTPPAATNLIGLSTSRSSLFTNSGFGQNASGFAGTTRGMALVGNRSSNFILPLPFSPKVSAASSSGKKRGHRSVGKPVETSMVHKEVPRGICIPVIQLRVFMYRLVSGNKVASERYNKTEAKIMRMMQLEKTVTFHGEDAMTCDIDIRSDFGDSLGAQPWKVLGRPLPRTKTALHDCILPQGQYSWNRTNIERNAEPPRNRASPEERLKRLRLAPAVTSIPVSEAAALACQMGLDQEFEESDDDGSSHSGGQQLALPRKRRISDDSSSEPEIPLHNSVARNEQEMFDYDAEDDVNDVVFLEEGPHLSSRIAPRDLVAPRGPSLAPDIASSRDLQVSQSLSRPNPGQFDFAIADIPTVYPPIPVVPIPGGRSERSPAELLDTVIAQVRSTVALDGDDDDRAAPFMFREGTEVRDWAQYYDHHDTTEELTLKPDFRIQVATDGGGPTLEGLQILFAEFRKFESNLFGGALFQGPDGAAVLTNATAMTPEAKTIVESFGALLYIGLIHGRFIPGWLSKSLIRSFCAFPFDYNEIKDLCPSVYHMVGEIRRSPNPVNLATVPHLEAWQDGHPNIRLAMLIPAGREAVAQAVLEEEFVGCRANNNSLVLRGFNRGCVVEYIRQLGNDFTDLEPYLIKVVETVCEFSQQYRPFYDQNFTDREKEVFSWFKNVVRTYGPEKLQKLLRFLTGSPNIPTVHKLSVTWVTGNGTSWRVPSTRTCFGRMFLDSTFPSEEVLRNHLENCLVTTGFQEA